MVVLKPAFLVVVGGTITLVLCMRRAKLGPMLSTALAAMGIIGFLIESIHTMAQTNRQKGKVLMILNEGKSADLQLMLTKEVGVMRDMLQKAGSQIVVATA